jgi:hypothetical protein
MIAIDIRADLRPMQRAMMALGAKQVPFATSLALNDLAKGVAEEERDAVSETFETPTPFTRNAFRIEVATKSRPIAIVAAKDIQAQYLAPYVGGGARYLGAKRGMLAPRAVGLNQYGNLTKGKIQSLKARPNVFVGPVKTRSGRIINGVWQRPTPGKGTRRGAHAAPVRRPLKLLIQFEDTSQVRKRLPFQERARRYVQRNAGDAFALALRRAMATAKS